MRNTHIAADSRRRCPEPRSRAIIMQMVYCRASVAFAGVAGSIPGLGVCDFFPFLPKFHFHVPLPFLLSLSPFLSSSFSFPLPPTFRLRNRSRVPKAGPFLCLSVSLCLSLSLSLSLSRNFIAPLGRRPRGSTGDYQVCVIVVTKRG